MSKLDIGIGLHQARLLCQMKPAERLDFIAEGLPLIFDSARDLWAASQPFMSSRPSLETMKPPLARAIKLTPGTEEVKGKCEKCGYAFVRKKTTLVGVRAFVLDGLDATKADEQRQADWKAINSLRNDLMHGLVDEEALGSRPHDALIPCMHYLHDAIGILSHSIDGPTQKYGLVRGGKNYLIAGEYNAEPWPKLSDWNEVIPTSGFQWVTDPKHGLVPQIRIQNRGIKNLELGFGQLAKPFTHATMFDMRPVPTASNP